jgi:hypothetical protein
MLKQRTKLIVVEENTLGYILPQLPNTLCILHASILKGSRYVSYSNIESFILPKEYRLATAADFEEFNQCFNGFMNPDQYEYDTSHHTVLEEIKIW